MGKLKLHQLFCDAMVLQRQAQVTIWGWAEPKAHITVHFADSTAKAAADNTGEWRVQIKTGSAGGPYQMRVTADDKETILVNDILLGDVWVCAGQSNMEMSMEGMKTAFPQEYADDDYPMIRQFRVPVSLRFDKPEADFAQGEWHRLSALTAAGFSAVGCTFAKEIYKNHHVPVGIILAALGGSNAESWMSKDALAPFPHFLDDLRRLAMPDYVEKCMAKEWDDRRKWRESADMLDRGLSAPTPYYAVSCDTTQWVDVTVPGYWAEQGLEAFNGVMWLRKTVTLPESFFTEDECLLHLGVVSEEDITYVNGVEIGSLPSVYQRRCYPVPKGLLKPGENVIAVRVLNYLEKGGLVPEKKYALVCGAAEVSLSGTWHCSIGGKMPPLAEPKNLQWKGATGLYNKMIAPMHQYGVKGILWYQGESNTPWAIEYGRLMRALIADWRKKWGSPNLPFFYVQLPGFMAPSSLPQESEWAQLREEQRKLQDIPGTGMAVTIDIGEWNDIHPQNKRDVGRRLARLARKQVYGEADLAAKGPELEKVEIIPGAVLLRFTHTAAGLCVREGTTLENFAAVHEDGIYQWVKAELAGDSVKLHDPAAAALKGIRYAWSDTPANGLLFNSEGLPASPFAWMRDTTDSNI